MPWHSVNSVSFPYKVHDFYAGPAATCACQVFLASMPPGRDPFASEDEFIAVLNAVQDHMSDFLTELMARDGGPTEQDSRELLELLVGWLAVPSDGHCIYDKHKQLSPDFLVNIVPPEDEDPVPIGLPGKCQKSQESVVVVNLLPRCNKEKGRAPPSSTLRRTSQHLAKALSVAPKEPVVEELPVPLPKHCGHPPKPEPIILKDELVFDKKRFKRIIECFRLDKLPSMKKAEDPMPTMPEPCLQCSIRKASTVENCLFWGWGVPCRPCDVSHVSSCAARDTICKRVSIHAPSALAALLDLVRQDSLHMCMPSAMLESICHRCNLNLREFANTLYELQFTGEIMTESLRDSFCKLGGGRGVASFRRPLHFKWSSHDSRRILSQGFGGLGFSFQPCRLSSSGWSLICAFIGYFILSAKRMKLCYTSLGMD
ncbi:uncharacterized protein LACBIDRAFT_324461 [Laccaria bicolor S238N-H82]|uniref:Predicted protein n=1 Tax=Laccaria bicolor (strain S238N-H82 / ATCC MYA-4686) TaxID=486041 RepID=B0D1W4_LACBS|nr:uncharacterized protein LACBIDRAFT_324461 [Laccaria bicolor S238N-H82]EDR11713.1 predicted protein [Laccaria bicolor S238N-H82]|eukprot:XP_001877610.1 predicted protein [Laccaria bicolor S238N-H82]